MIGLAVYSALPLNAYSVHARHESRCRRCAWIENRASGLPIESLSRENSRHRRGSPHPTARFIQRAAMPGASAQNCRSSSPPPIRIHYPPYRAGRMGWARTSPPGSFPVPQALALRAVGMSRFPVSPPEACRGAASGGVFPLGIRGQTVFSPVCGLSHSVKALALSQDTLMTGRRPRPQP